MPCHRPQQSAKKYLLQHEKVRYRADAVKTLLPAGGRLEDHVADKCVGITIGSGVCKLDGLEESCKKWMSIGMLRLRPGKEDKDKDPLEAIRLHWSGDRLVAKHKDCTAQVTRRHACPLCISVCNSQDVATKIAHWAARIDLVQYAQVLVFGMPDDKVKSRHDLLLADYYVNKLCLHDVDDILRLDNDCQKVNMIKKKIESLPRRLRTPQLDTWIQTHLQTLEAPEGDGSERAAFNQMVQVFAHKVADGTVEHADLQLAAKVASGELQADRVVSCLLRSFCNLQERRKRGTVSRRECSSKYIDDEVLDEITVRLGKGREAKSLLRVFGVNPKCVNRPIDFEHSLLPAFFVPCRAEEEMVRNCKVVLERLSSSGQRVIWLSKKLHIFSGFCRYSFQAFAFYPRNFASGKHSF